MNGPPCGWHGLLSRREHNVRPHGWSGLALALISALGCSTDIEKRTELVSGATPVWEEAERWRVSVEPVVTIGETHGQLPYVFGNVGDATVLSDGRLVISDNQSSEVRYYDRRGRHLYTSGREGEGPGEFDLVSELVRMPGDTVVVIDPQLQRVSIIDSSGHFARSIPLSSDGFTDAVAIDPRTILMVEDLSSLSTMLEEGGLVRDDQRITLLDVVSGSLAPIAPIKGREHIRTLRPGRVSRRRAAFARSTYVTASPGRYFIGNSTSDSIRAYDRDGNLIARIGGVRAVHPVTPAAVRRYYQSIYSPQILERLWTRQDHRDAAPPTTPAYDQLVADPEGNLWVCRFQPPWSNEFSRWDVHDPAGRWLGTVELPIRLHHREELLEVGTDYVLLLLRDDLDVQRVAKYRLIKPGPARVSILAD